jgi:hypothetical protein
MSQEEKGLTPQQKARMKGLPLMQEALREKRRLVAEMTPLERAEQRAETIYARKIHEIARRLQAAHGVLYEEQRIGQRMLTALKGKRRPRI